MIMHLTMSARRAAVRLQMAAHELGQRAEGFAERRVDAWRDDGERGAQAAEYAMLGGVSAAACSGLVAILKNRETLSALVESVISTLGEVIEGWF